MMFKETAQRIIMRHNKCDLGNFHQRQLRKSLVNGVGSLLHRHAIVANIVDYFSFQPATIMPSNSNYLQSRVALASASKLEYYSDLL